MNSLITKIQASDQSAFTELYNLFHKKIYCFILKYVRSEEMAKELTQMLFIKIWEKRKMLSTKKSVESQLFIVARNLTIDELRRMSRQETLKETYKKFNPSSIYSLEEDLRYSELQNQVQNVIDQLPAKRKKIYQMSREEGLSYRQISSQLDISSKTVETQIRLALKTLRTKLTSFLHLLF